MLRSLREKGTSWPSAKTTSKQPEASKQHGPGKCRNNGHYQRKVNRNAGETVIGDYVEQDQGGCGNDSQKNDKRNYDPLFRTPGRWAEINKCCFWG